MAAVFVANLSMAQQGFESIISLSSSETYWDGSDLTGASNGAGLFDTSFTDGYFEFVNQYDTTWGSPGYWSAGWVFSNQTSDALIGLSGQYSSYAGGASFGSNYATGFDGSKIVILDTSKVISNISVTNSNYAAHSMINGDSFAKKFGSVNDANGNPDGTNGEDWFLLTIIGHDHLGNAVDSVEFYLADYRFSDDNQDYIVKTWTDVDISSIGVVSSLSFNLSSSDVGQWGMNTPKVIAIDELEYSSVGVSEEHQETITAFPNPTNNFITIEVTENSAVQLFDLSGKLVMTKTITTSNNQISLLELPKGVYQLVIADGKSIQTTKVVKL